MYPLNSNFGETFPTHWFDKNLEIIKPIYKVYENTLHVVWKYLIENGLPSIEITKSSVWSAVIILAKAYCLAGKHEVTCSKL